MLLAWKNGDIDVYTSFASQKIRRSLWNIRGVRVRLKFPSPAIPALKNGVWTIALAVENEPYECPPIPSF